MTHSLSVVKLKAVVFSGVGFSMLVVSFLCCVYYNVIIAWCLYYMFKSFASIVPWANCDNWWNTPSCSLSKKSSNGITNTTTLNDTINGTAASSNVASLATVGGDSPSKEFWDNYVLQIPDNMDDLGSMRVELLVALIVAWILVYFCLWKGIKSSGKVVYFTATFPYVVLVILLIRGVTLPGAWKGIEFYLKPDFKKLGDASVWATAATQIFYSLGIGFGSLITMGSFNQFHNNCFR